MVSFLMLISLAGAYAWAQESIHQPAETRITEDTILNILKTHHPTSIDELMGLLPPELRSNYSLVYDTRNKVQHASADKPRIILFSNDGGFHMALTGDASVPGGNKIEMITQQGDGNFKFSQVEFIGPGKWEHSASPESCKACHGKVPKPIWDGYPFWPGVYGSDHRKLKDLRIIASAPHLRDGLEEAEQNFKTHSTEYRNLQSFLSQKASQGRYAHLTHLKDSGYTELANLNSHYSNVLVKAHGRQIMTPLLNQPEFKKYRSWFFEKYASEKQNHERVFYLNHEKDLEGVKGENAEKLLNELNEIKPQRNREIENYYKKILDRFLTIDPQVRSQFMGEGKLELGFSGSLELGRFDQDAYTALELIYKKLGFPAEVWTPHLQGSARYSGGEKLSSYEVWKVAVEQLVSRDPGFAKYVVADPKDKGAVPRKIITPEGLALLKSDRYQIPPGSAHFSPEQNHYPFMSPAEKAQIRSALFLKETCKKGLADTLRGFLFGRGKK